MSVPFVTRGRFFLGQVGRHHPPHTRKNSFLPRAQADPERSCDRASATVSKKSNLKSATLERIDKILALTEALFKLQRTKANTTEIGESVVTIVVTQPLFRLVSDAFTYETRRARESNPRFDCGALASFIGKTARGRRYNWRCLAPTGYGARAVIRCTIDFCRCGDFCARYPLRRSAHSKRPIT